MAKEVDIIKLVKSRRIVNMALKRLLDAQVFKELKQKSQIKQIKVTAEEIKAPTRAVNQNANKA